MDVLAGDAGDAPADALPPRTIDGWLSVFVVLMGLVGLVLMVQGISLLPLGLFGVALGLWAWYVVYAMVNVRPGAAYNAVFLLTTLLLLSGVSLYNGLRGDASPRALFGTVRDLIFSGLWLVYFNQSRRVGWTFGYGKWAALRSADAPFDTKAMEPAAPLRLDAWDGAPVRKCPACGLANPESAYRCRECGQSLNGTVPFVPEDTAVPPPAGP